MARLNYELRVALEHTSPRVWRRIRVPADTDLETFHEILQDVMGWEGYHLYAFEGGGYVYGEPDPDFSSDMIDAQQVPLQDVLVNPGDTMAYVYDFGDDWVHKITLKKLLPQSSPFPVCLSGSGACPPEDCGGPARYRYYLSALADTAHPDHERAREWLGDDHDPTKFDIEAANWMLKTPTDEDELMPESIAGLISSFLRDQLGQVAPSTCRKYERALESVMIALDSYGYNNNPGIDYDSVQEAGKTFCEVATIEALLNYMKEFFGYFMPRKMHASINEVSECRTALRRFLQWLSESDMIDPEAAQAYRRQVSRLAAEGIKAARVRWYEFAPVETPPHQVDETLEDHFTITRVEPGKLWLEDMNNTGTPGMVRAPRAFTDLCEPEMDLAAEIQRTGDRWYLVDVYNAYPKP